MGVNVVVPVSLSVENSQSIGEDTYVVYPFIKERSIPER